MMCSTTYSDNVNVIDANNGSSDMKKIGISRLKLSKTEMNKKGQGLQGIYIWSILTNT